MVFRPRILQDVAEYAIRTEGRSAGGPDESLQDFNQLEPSGFLVRDDRGSASLTSASAIALGPWAVFALSFLILAAYRDEIEEEVGSLFHAVDLDGLRDLSHLLAGDPPPLPMFGQRDGTVDQVSTVSVDEVLEAPSFSAGPNLAEKSVTSGPLAVATLPDELFKFDLGAPNDDPNTNAVDDRRRDYSVAPGEPTSTKNVTPVKFDPDEGNDEGGDEGGDEGRGDGPGRSGTIIWGTDKDERLTGTADDDAIFGQAGSDVLEGGFGDDYIFGGSGSNSIDGGHGHDIAGFTGASTDYSVFRNEDGNLTVVHLASGDRTKLENVERIYFADGNLDVSELPDGFGRVLYSGLLDRQKTTRDLLDELDVGELDDTDENPGSGDGSGDIINGDSGDNDLIGTEGDDLIFGGPGNDRMAGMGGDDLLVAEPGNDLIDGGEGFDAVGTASASTDQTLFRNQDGSFRLVNTVTGDTTTILAVERLYFGDGFVDLSAMGSERGEIDLRQWLDPSMTSQDLIDQYGGAEEDDPEGEILIPAPADLANVIRGDEGDNDIVGSDGNDLIVSGAGDDRVAGLGGNDVLAVAPGSDLVDGGDGTDLAAFQSPSTKFSLYLMSDGSFSVVNELTEEETILIDVEHLLFADGSVDLTQVDQLGQVDLPTLLDRSTTVSDIEPLFSLPEDGGGIVPTVDKPGITLVGDGMDNHLIGSQGADILVGGAGDDRIEALDGDDLVIAEPGSDLVDGGGGQDAVAIQGLSKGYSLYKMTDGSYSLIDNASETETVLRNVEQIYFGDGFVDIAEFRGPAGMVDMSRLIDTTRTSSDLLVNLGDVLEQAGAEDEPDEYGLLVVGTEAGERLTGSDVGDFIIGGAGDDELVPLAGDDIVIAGPGNDAIDGGAGFDIAGFDAPSTSFALTYNEDGSYRLDDTKGGDSVHLVDVESLYFNDGAVDLTTPPDREGIVHMGDLLDTDSTVEDLYGLSGNYAPASGGTDEDDGADPFPILVPPPVTIFDQPLVTNSETGENV